MISLKKKKNTIYSIIILIIFIISGTFINSFIENSRTVLLIFGPLICLMFILAFEDISFNGRYSNIDSLLWFVYLISSIVIITIFIVFIGFILDTLNIYVNYSIRSSFSSVLVFSILFYFVFKFIQLIYKRLQDFNQPGYYLIGIIPIVSWFIGIKIYKSGEKILGVLVFLNLTIALIYILFVSGNYGVNYFGIRPKYCRNFLREYKKLLKASSIAQEDKNLLVQELNNKYLLLESSETEKFIKAEVTRLIKKEKIIVKDNSKINESRIVYFKSIVQQKMEKNYNNNCPFRQ